MAEHTKGPWSRNIKPARKYNTIFAGRNTHVCYLASLSLSDEEIEANCDLITAAPELLDLIKRIAHPHGGELLTLEDYRCIARNFLENKGLV